MKAVCTGTGKHTSLLNICLEVGRTYSIEEAEKGTNNQNSAFHALCTEYYKSGLHSYSNDFKTFKDHIKKDLGQGFNSFIYVELIDNKPIIKDAKKYEDIPEEIRKDQDFKNLIRGKLKSWSDYTKKQRKDTIGNLISEMRLTGVNSKKFDEIIKGMENNG